MQRKRIARRSMLRERRITVDQLGRGNEVERSSRQHRHMQGLANVTSVFGTIRVLVEQAAARCKIEQRGASQDRERAAHSDTSEDRSPSEHS